MAGDHLTARQTSITTIAQHPLTDTSTGLYWRSSTTDDWAANAANSHRLPGHGLVGSMFVDAGVNLSSADHTTTTSGFSMECVYTNTNTGYNFFGGTWQRWPMHYYGNANGQYAIRYGLELFPINDQYTDTQGRIRALVSDVGGTWIASTTVHSRPVSSDGAPHHICMTHAGSPTVTNAVKVYVDGVLTETSTLNAGRSQVTLYGNWFNVGVDASYVHPNGSVSHACVTPTELSAAEVATRAKIAMMQQSQYKAWDGTNGIWVS